jgi:hypothetical protein
MARAAGGLGPTRPLSERPRVIERNGVGAPLTA